MLKAVLLGALCFMANSALTVTGTADVPKPIDYVEVQFAIQVTKPSAALAIQQAQKTAKKVEKALDIDVSSPNVQVDEQGKGFTATVYVQADISQPDNLGKAIDIAFKNGATDIQQVTFQADDQKASELYDQLVKQAVQDATQKAQDYAQALGQDLGQIKGYVVVDQNDQQQQQDSDLVVQVQVQFSLGSQGQGDQEQQQGDQQDQQQEQEQQQQEQEQEEQEDDKKSKGKNNKKSKKSKKQEQQQEQQEQQEQEQEQPPKKKDTKKKK